MCESKSFVLSTFNLRYGCSDRHSVCSEGIWQFVSGDHREVWLKIHICLAPRVGGFEAMGGMKLFGI